MNTLLAAAEPAAIGMSASAMIAAAAVLMLLAAALAIVEFLIVSWGMLLIAALISAIAAISIAFRASDVAGWCFVAATPVLAVAVVRIGLALMRRNVSAVLPTEISADAGYRHVADQAGIVPGAIGELTTPATPSGRASFNGRNGPVELDVRVQGPTLDRGRRVVVLVIDGAAVTVAAAPVSEPVNPAPKV